MYALACIMRWYILYFLLRLFLDTSNTEQKERIKRLCTFQLLIFFLFVSSFISFVFCVMRRPAPFVLCCCSSMLSVCKTYVCVFIRSYYIDGGGLACIIIARCSQSKCIIYFCRCVRAECIIAPSEFSPNN